MPSDWIARSGDEILGASDGERIGSARLLGDVEIALLSEDDPVALTPSGPSVSHSDPLAALAVLDRIRPGVVFDGLPDLAADAPVDAAF